MRTLLLLASYCLITCTGFAADLQESTYLLSFSEGREYLVFSNGDKKGYSNLQWSCPDCVGSTYGVTMNGPRQLTSSSGDSLNITLAWPHQSGDITFYNSSNFTEAVSWQVVDQYALLKCPLLVTLPEHQLVPPGNYSAVFDLNLFDINQILISTHKITIAVTVASSQTLELSLSEQAYSTKRLVLSFPEALTSQSRPFFCHIVSNSPYIIQVRSLNGGKLKMNPSWIKPNYSITEIDYDFSFEGNLIVLNKNFLNIYSGNNPLLGNKNTHRAEITIHPDISKHWEGVYEDEIVFCVSSCL